MPSLSAIDTRHPAYTASLVCGLAVIIAAALDGYMELAYGIAAATLFALAYRNLQSAKTARAECPAAITPYAIATMCRAAAAATAVAAVAGLFTNPAITIAAYLLGLSAALSARYIRDAKSKAGAKHD